MTVVTYFNPKHSVIINSSIMIINTNECKRKQKEEEKRLAEQYSMPYEEEDNEEENSIK